ncbi:MAG: type II secretion system ATPase GspE [Candidatus Omnitrophica bacterium]|nr:type II secretion system ATPase GspE [Candidatus Omnitrophota bacterium]
MAKKQDTIELLLKKSLVTQDQIDRATQEVKRTGLTMEGALERLGFITENDIANVRAQSLGVPFMDLTGYIIDSALVKLIPEKLAKRSKAVPLFKIGSSLTVAMIDPKDIVVLDELRRVSKMDTIEPVLATEKGIQRILDTYYGVAGSIDDIVKSIGKDSKSETAFASKDILREAAEEPPIIKLVNVMIMEAVKDRASDIHIEPEEDLMRVRYRIDGILHEVNTLPTNLHRAIVSRIKILSQLDIAESRKPQDGRIRLKIEDRDLDIRVSTFPTIHGENVVMRLLDRSSVLVGLHELGLAEKELGGFEKLIKRPNGIILVTGPTGSGKTTTLYAALTTINSMDKNIITIEDPVEYELPLIRQTSINPKAGITFANGLRSILRQDPDVIMVGEIRDKETVEISIQAALTGHLVLSTLHTNDAPSALTRLIDIGVEPFLISSSVIGVVAQRLVRKICDKCKEKYMPDDSVLKDLGIEKKIELYRGKGCNKCKKTGFAGRIAIFEIFIVNEDMKKMVNSRVGVDEIRKKAIELGMKGLRDDGLEKVKKGITTPCEVLRVTEIKE